ncbi:hypothetical protein LSH36_1413g00009 [Paralvinella palmiformis]|uniref:Uncharacterized protein n=1 Tax=Paralvinella palmiformis TaxID=53620 RepID=A0AAD9ITF6_9ANNE|nr:hypothetical protein LSH36_1413g00009 [Paralvinella palmiformis]
MSDIMESSSSGRFLLSNKSTIITRESVKQKYVYGKQELLDIGELTKHWKALRVLSPSAVSNVRKFGLKRKKTNQRGKRGDIEQRKRRIIGERNLNRDHFIKDDYKWSGVRKRLKPGTVPSQFPFRPMSKGRRLLKKKIQYISSCEDDNADDSHDNSSPTSDQEEGLIAVDEIESDEITIAKLKAELEENKIIAASAVQISKLEHRLKIEHLGLERFGHDASMVALYTGFSSQKPSFPSSNGWNQQPRMHIVDIIHQVIHPV